MKNVLRVGLMLTLLLLGFAFYLASQPVQAAPLRIDCPRSDIEVRFTNPKPNDTVARSVQLEGSTKVPDFQAYQLYVAPA